MHTPTRNIDVRKDCARTMYVTVSNATTTTKYKKNAYVFANPPTKEQSTANNETANNEATDHQIKISIS